MPRLTSVYGYDNRGLYFRVNQLPILLKDTPQGKGFRRSDVIPKNKPEQCESRTSVPKTHRSGSFHSAGAVKKSHIPGVKITSVDHGSCVGDKAVEGGLADATAPGHSSVN
ncbi:hypothetical protein Bca52824_084657 [Brassica carinata]|uniref:Uncharacterized protein n=1 Tax=Brassica carinata TaxID=52824 RepID=A0A8X7TV00_BRACI|nr:hypothetical protein Bca52824_084657 [Brassica carinata]